MRRVKDLLSQVKGRTKVMHKWIESKIMDVGAGPKETIIKKEIHFH